MRFLFVLLFSLFLSCSNPIEDAFNTANTQNHRMIVIENCQYIIVTYGPRSSYRGYGFMAHKGNCNNDFHRGMQK